MLAGARSKSPEQRPNCYEENPKIPVNPAGSGRLLACDPWRILARLKLGD
jgi:hypothetical protein